MNIDIESNKDKIIELLQSTKRPNIDKIINKLKSDGFFSSPASVKYHLNVPGGLAQHSLSVYKALESLCQTFNVSIPTDSVIISGLLHDVCKVGLYIPTQTGYLYNQSQPKGHGSLSVKRVKHFIELTPLEENLIRWHMNRYDVDFKSKEKYLQSHYPEVYLIYFADHISTLYLED